MVDTASLIATYKRSQDQLIKAILSSKSVAFNTAMLQTVNAELAKLQGHTVKWVEKNIPAAYVSGMEAVNASYTAQLTAAGKPVFKKYPTQFSVLNRKAINVLVENTKADFTNALGFVGRKVKDDIRKASLEAIADKVSTGTTVEKTRKILAQKFADQGLSAIKYQRKGKNVYMNLESYAGTVARSTTAEATNTGTKNQVQELGEDLVQMTQHSSSCPVCSVLEGRVYSISGKNKSYPPLSKAYTDGYANIHPNCGHRLVPYIAELKTPEELEADMVFSKRSFDPTRWKKAEKQKLEANLKAYKAGQDKKRKLYTSKQQWEQYKAVLGSDAPKSLSAFNNMKKANSPKWQTISKDFRAKKKLMPPVIKDPVVLAENNLAQLNLDVKLKKVALAQLEQDVGGVLTKLADYRSNRVFGIFSDTVGVDDYEELVKTGRMAAKRKYYEDQLAKSPEWTKNKLAILDDYEQKSKEYLQYLKDHGDDVLKLDRMKVELSALEDAAKKAKKDLDKLLGVEDLYSPERRNAAKWFREGQKKAADTYFRPKTAEVWKGLDKAHRNAAYQYTAGSGKYNRPLRGYDKDWSNFKGIGKVSLDNEGAATDIVRLADTIKQSEFADDVWLNRGVSDNKGFANFLGISERNLQYWTTRELEQNLMGKVVQDAGFLSTSPVRGSGFGGHIINLYCPKGTQGLYAEPFSAYGGGHAGAAWNGVSSQSSFGSEFEIILNKGYSYKVTKINKVGSKFYIDVDVILD